MTYTCCCCLKENEGFGNNPSPLVPLEPNVRCCDKCNIMVGFVRISMLRGGVLTETGRRNFLRCLREDNKGLAPIFEMYGFTK